MSREHVGIAIIAAFFFSAGCEDEDRIACEGSRLRFADAEFVQAVRHALDAPYGVLCSEAAEEVTYMNEIGRGVRDLNGIQAFTAIEELSLSYNRISDLSPLSDLTSIEKLDLRANRIWDLEPLVSNSGIDEGDIVNVSQNLIDETAEQADIDELCDRGVRLIPYCPEGF